MVSMLIIEYICKEMDTLVLSAIVVLLSFLLALFIIIQMVHNIKKRNACKNRFADEYINVNDITENSNAEKDTLIQENECLKAKIKELEEQINGFKRLDDKNESVQNSKFHIEKMRKDIERLEGIAQYYKRQLELIQSAPNIKSITHEILPILSALKDYESIVEEDRLLYINMQTQKIVRFLEAQNMKVIISQNGDDYNPNIHSAVGTMPDDSGTLKGKIQTSVCCGIQYFDDSIEKEEVILYI